MHEEIKIVPLHDFVYVERDELPKMSEGGIHIPGMAQKRDQADTGIVRAVGKGYTNPKTGKIMPLECKVGDKVIFGKYRGDKVKVPGLETELLMIHEPDIFAIIGREE